MTGLLRRDTVQKVLHYAALIIVTGVVCFPLLWALSSSMKPADELFVVPPTIVPNAVTMENYEALIHGKPMYVQHETTGYTPGTSPTQHFLAWFANSIIVAGGASLISVAISTLAAYSLTRFRYRGQQAIPYLSLVGYMMPPIVLVFPLFLLIVDLGLVNNLLSLVLGYVALTMPFCTWMLWAFFRGLPIEVEEAGLIDGASRFQVFRQIVVPSARHHSGRDLLADRRLERLSVRAHLHQLGPEAAAHGRRDALLRGRARQLGPDDGIRGADDAAARRPVHAVPAPAGRGLRGGRDQGLRWTSASSA